MPRRGWRTFSPVGNGTGAFELASGSRNFGTWICSCITTLPLTGKLARNSLKKNKKKHQLMETIFL